MDNADPKLQGQPNQERKIDEQFPVDTKVITSVRISLPEPASDLARGVVMNDQETAQHSPRREYYFSNGAVPIDDVASFVLQCGTMDGTQSAIDGFVGSMALHVSDAQPCQWTSGQYSPSAPRRRLFKAIDPADNTKMIGLVVEQDEANQLVRLTWYKTNGAGPIFPTAPAALNFDVVRDENGTPSLDPNHIGGWIWYHSIPE